MAVSYTHLRGRRMTVTDWVMVGAVLLGPLIAVQLTRFLDDLKEEKGRKLWVFKTLMASRAQGLSAVHVEALNRIELEFTPKKSSDKAVLEAWKAYLDFLGDKNFPADTWPTRRTDLFVDLLHKMGKGLNYDLDKTTIKNSIYSPTGHERLEDDQTAIRQGVRKLLEGTDVYKRQASQCQRPECRESHAGQPTQGHRLSLIHI